VDLEDAVYKTKKEKFDAVIDEAVEAHAKGQPVLVGTITIETSELVASLLKKRGIPHISFLNAKFHEKEAEIVAHAGARRALPSPPTWPAVVPISSWTMRREPRAV
jgi:preprotein translocase subunit SecA